MSRELLIDLINIAFIRGYVYFERDILAPQIDKLDIRSFRFDGYTARICDMNSYFDENMKLLDDENLDALFSPVPYIQRSVMTTPPATSTAPVQIISWQRTVV